MPNGLLSALGVAQLKTYLEALARYAGVQTVLTLGLLVLVVLALGFGVTGLTIWLAAQWGAAAAFAAVGAGFLALAALLEIVIVVRRNRRMKRAPAFKGEMPDQAALGSVAAVAILGYILGRQIMRR